jgi:mRNA interferase RelE/StbE
MAAYEVFFKKSVWKDFKSIPDRDLKRILAAIEKLAEDPRCSGSRKLSGQDVYRFRQGRYRIIYSIQDAELTIWIVRVGHRQGVYRKCGSGVRS